MAFKVSVWMLLTCVCLIHLQVVYGSHEAKNKNGASRLYKQRKSSLDALMKSYKRNEIQSINIANENMDKPIINEKGSIAKRITVQDVCRVCQALLDYIRSKRTNNLVDLCNEYIKHC